MNEKNTFERASTRIPEIHYRSNPVTLAGWNNLVGTPANNQKKHLYYFEVNENSEAFILNPSLS